MSKCYFCGLDAHITTKHGFVVCGACARAHLQEEPEPQRYEPTTEPCFPAVQPLFGPYVHGSYAERILMPARVVVNVSRGSRRL